VLDVDEEAGVARVLHEMTPRVVGDVVLAAHLIGLQKRFERLINEPSRLLACVISFSFINVRGEEAHGHTRETLFTHENPWAREESREATFKKPFPRPHKLS
jgi:hypothetical protein